MTHVITQSCCNDAACVPACPVNCIHPTPDEPGYRTTEMLYIDPNGCVDCGACLDVCPVSAIHPDYELPEEFARYEDINAMYFADPVRSSYDPDAEKPAPTKVEATQGPLRVAIVGSGPAAVYAAEELLAQKALGAEVDLFERLPTPGGLVRFGVAPDHVDTKAAGDVLARTMRRKGLRMFANTEVGRDVTHEQLLERYHAVLYAVGAMADRALGIPGEDLPGSISATELVGWYNGHPDFVDRAPALDTERVVVIGNGNVALDVARILALDAARLSRTDTADHALEVLGSSAVTEVVVVGRRGPLEAAFTTPELLGLAELDDLDLVVRPDEIAVSAPPAGEVFSMGPVKAELLAELGVAEPSADRRIVFRFLASPVEVVGTDRVEAVRLERTELVEEGGRVVAKPTGEIEEIPCGLVVRSVGFRGTAVADLPFDAAHGVLPQEAGRVVDPDTRAPLPGVYAAGWIKRGPSGVIGTNKWCARETVASLLADYSAGTLNVPVDGAGDVADLLPDHVDLKGWQAIDAFEKAAGKAARRPRVKVVDVARMLEIAAGE